MAGHRPPVPTFPSDTYEEHLIADARELYASSRIDLPELERRIDAALTYDGPPPPRNPAKPTTR